MAFIKKLFLILLCVIVNPGLAEANQKIVVIQSVRVRPYKEALEGFKSVCQFEVNKLVISESRGEDVIKKVHEIRPNLVVAIGRDALSRAREIKNIPVLYLMVLTPPDTLAGERNITGVRMNISQESQLRMFLKVLPHIKRVGLLYNPDNTGNLVQSAREAARKVSIDLVAKEIHRAGEAPASLVDMKGKIDAFWMLPDISVITPETTEFLLLFSLQNKVPILTFSEKYVELGALMSIGIDPFDIGLQAGEMAKKILAEGEVKNVIPVDPRKPVISINLKIARKLGIYITEDAIKNARIVR